MPITHSIDHENKTLTILVSGQFNFADHPEFRASYDDIKGQAYTAIVDLRNAESMDSAALGMLLLLDEAFPGMPAKIINANDFIKQVLDIAHFGKKFEIS